MEATTFSIAITIVTVVIVSCSWSVMNWVWFKPKKLEKCLRQQGLNGNPYRLLIGDQQEITKMLMEAKTKPMTMSMSNDIIPRVLPFLHQAIKNYGKNCFVWIGCTPRVNIMDPELVKDIFNKIDTFHKPVFNPLVKLLLPGFLTYEGEKWVKHRKIINPAFHSEKLKNMLSAFDTSCSIMMEKWEKLVATEGSCELEVSSDVQNMTSDVISRCAFGSSFEEGRKLFKLLKEQTSLTTLILQSVYIPGWSFLPTKTNTRLKAIDKEILVMIKGIINKREKAMKLGEAARNDDLLALLMESNKKDGMTIREVIDECKLFYFAGQETTAVLLVWTLIMLGKHQEWQTRMRNEVLRVFGNDLTPTMDGLNHLKIMTMFLHEVLRLYPPATILSRIVHKDTKLGNLTIPAGTELGLPIILMHHDHNIWGADALEFNPNRFSEGISKATKNQVVFFPFGWGPRNCVGQNMAMIEAKLDLAMILKRFSFELSPSYQHGPFPSPNVQPQYGAQLILRKL